jgi:hypothetical protein
MHQIQTSCSTCIGKEKYMVATVSLVKDDNREHDERQGDVT